MFEMAGTTLNIASSGLRAARDRMNVSANNTANVNTIGFKKKKVLNNEIKNGGVRSTVEQINTPGDPAVDEKTGELVEGSNVNIIEESIEMIKAEKSFKANAAALKARDEMLGKIINIKS